MTSHRILIIFTTLALLLTLAPTELFAGNDESAEQTAQLKLTYDSVARNVWAPLAPLITGGVHDIAKNLPTIREKLREAYRPQ